MKTTKIRTLFAAGTIGVVGLTGIVAASAAGAVGTSGSAAPTKARLTVEQKACMSAQGITKPEGRPTAEQRTAIVEAAKNCGITVPTGKAKAAPTKARLTVEQKACMSAQGITKPEGRPTAEGRAAFKEQLKTAAQTCGISRPAAAPTN